MIRKTKSGYKLVSHAGKNLGEYKTKTEAEAREKQIKMFKSMKAKKPK